MVPRSELLRLLASHPAEGEEERRALRAMTAMVGSLPEATSRFHYDPGHFTASAFVTDRACHRMLLVRHAKLGIWVQPGGHIEPADADLLAAAVRETAEETGMVAHAPAPGALLDVDVHTIPERDGRPAHLHLDVRFHLVAASGSIRPSAEVEDVRWVALEDVVDLTTELSVLRPVGKLRRLSGGTP